MAEGEADKAFVKTFLRPPLPDCGHCWIRGGCTNAKEISGVTKLLGDHENY